MATSRRKFLQTGSLVALTAGLPLGAAAKSFAGANSLFSIVDTGSTSQLDMDAFVRSLQTKFLLTARAKTATVKLAEVKDCRTGQTRNGNRECFSLLFIAPENVALRQDTYAVKHDALGEFSMLVVPVGGNYHEAVFNRLY